MRRISLTLSLAFLTVLFCQAQVTPLKFNKNGEFTSSSLPTSIFSITIQLQPLP